MGHNTMKLANGPLYRNVQGLDFRVLMYLAQTVLDDDRGETPGRTYFGGIEAIVEHVYGLIPGDEGYRSKFNTIQKSIRHLIDLGALRRTKSGTGGNRGWYEICPLQSTLTSADLHNPQVVQPVASSTTPRLSSAQPTGSAVHNLQDVQSTTPRLCTDKETTKDTTKDRNVRATSPREPSAAFVAALEHLKTSTTVTTTKGNRR
jgi:hypothetical protein